MKREYQVGTVVALMTALIVWALVSGYSGSPTDPEVEREQQAMRAEIESGLKNAATATETYAVDNNGSYVDADESDLIALGLQLPENVTWAGHEFGESSYCLVLEHQQLPRDHPWRIASYSSDVGATSPADDCS